MCGIFGTLNYRISEERFRSSLDLLKHRGPDGSGVWSSDDQSVRIGHRRLAIIDTSIQGHQPMIANDRYIISYNGEIYNYIELRQSLEKKGIRFKTQSDTEVLLNLIINEGVEALNQLNGMWAFVVYDKVEQSLLISRDRLGEKPLYFIHDKDKFAFASEMKSLYNKLEEFNYNKDFINYYLANPFDNEWKQQTIIEGIQKFPAGYYAFFRNGKIEMNRYYNPAELLQQPQRYKSINEAVDEFKLLFSSSCMMRMRSDVSVGSSLSGGIDSGLLVSTVAHQIPAMQKDYHAVISSFPGSALDETDSAITVAQKAGIPYKKVNVSPNLSPDQILKAVYDFEDIAGTSPLPFYQTYQAFRENNILVTLDGHGGDELFGGYPFDLQSKMRDDFPNIFRTRQTLQTINDMGGNDQRISIGLAWLNTYKEYKRRRAEHEPILGNINAYSKQLHHSTFSGILPTLLRNYDKYSMRSGVEIRMPYLDYRIVEFAFRLPAHFKINNGFSKFILRQASRGMLPDAIVNNKIKSGWNSPMGEWFNTVWKEWLLDEISSVDFNQSDLVSSSQIRKLVHDFYLKGNADQKLGQLIWLYIQPHLIQKANKIFQSHI